MLHNLTVTSAAAVLKVLHEQTEEDISVSDLVTDIPDDIEEQEKMLQVCYYASTHLHYKIRSWVMSIMEPSLYYLYY